MHSELLDREVKETTVFGEDWLRTIWGKVGWAELRLQQTEKAWVHSETEKLNGGQKG